MSRAKFAEALGIPAHKVQDVERGKVKVSLDFLRRMRKVFGSEADFLLEDVEESQLAVAIQNRNLTPSTDQNKTTNSNDYSQSQPTTTSQPPVAIHEEAIATEPHDPAVPLDLEGPVDLRMVRLVIELAEAWLEEVQKAWTPAKKAEAYCILAQLAESLRTSGLGDDAIRDQIRPLLRIVTAQ